MSVKTPIEKLREYLRSQLNLIARDLSQTSIEDVQLRMGACFESLTNTVNHRLDAIEKEFVAIQSAASIKKPSRNWHYIVLAGGVMFTIGLISGAVLGTLGALG